MTRVFAAPAPVGTERVMLLALADNANDEGFCWPGIPRLRRKCALTTDRGARKVIERLIEWSETAPPDCVIVRVQRTGGSTNTYTLTLVGGGPAPDLQDRAVRPDRGALRDRSEAVRADRAGTVSADREGLSVGTAEPSENRQSNPHHNHTHATGGNAGADGVAVGKTENGKAAEGDPRHVGALVDRGVRPDVAHRLVATFSDRIDGALAAFDRSGGAGGGPKYGPGWLVRAVESGWAAERPATADTPPQGAYGTVPEPRRMFAQAALWLEEHGHRASALLDFFEPAGTWEMDPDLPPVAMYRLRGAVGGPESVARADKSGVLKKVVP